MVALLGSYNSLFLAPEVSEEKLVTEKVTISPLVPSTPSAQSTLSAQSVVGSDGPNVALTSREGLWLHSLLFSEGHGCALGAWAGHAPVRGHRSLRH